MGMTYVPPLPSSIRRLFRRLFSRERYVTHALLARLPLTPKGPLDLHALSTPPAFILSQDQTLNINIESLVCDWYESHTEQLKIIVFLAAWWYSIGKVQPAFPL